MKKVFITIALFALAVPAALAAPPPGKGNQGAGAPVGSDVTQSTVPSADEQCKELLRAMGAADFRSTYTAGSRARAMDKCVSREIRSASADVENAAKACKEERAKDPAAFKAKYGTNINKANAFGKCVSALASAAAEDRQEAIENAAKACKDERAKDPAAFKAKYGTNINKANAFGKCVSALASAAAEDRQEAIENAAKACKDERAKDPAAFKAKYGTNINKANAFGKCVSQTVKKSA